MAANSNMELLLAVRVISGIGEGMVAPAFNVRTAAYCCTRVRCVRLCRARISPLPLPPPPPPLSLIIVLRSQCAGNAWEMGAAGGAIDHEQHCIFRRICRRNGCCPTISGCSWASDIDDSSTSFLVNSRTLMGCAHPTSILSSR